ncbi:hypothetical protein O6H91_12G080000 [Diphasiastrum complanatum]|uniref:Uncharacterized protein n=1 Tax=Diphasiastrum complanatum TaxID=34168 RepID=A0ACC2C3Y6_DIPCM|nr:hypothetical protein O6H91_12G080000 [Diphasiastrum complanatum]
MIQSCNQSHAMLLHLKEWVGKETRKLTTRTNYCRNHLQQSTIIDEKKFSRMPHKTRTGSSKDNKRVHGLGSYAKCHPSVAQEENNKTLENLVIKNEEGNPNCLQLKLFYREQSRLDLVHEAIQTGGGKPYFLPLRQEHDSSVLATSNSTGGEKAYSLEGHEQDIPAVKIEELCRELGKRETLFEGQNRDQKMTTMKMKGESKFSPGKKLLTKLEKKKCIEKRQISKKRLEVDKGRGISGTVIDHYGQKRVKLRHSDTAQPTSRDGPLAYSFISLKLLKAECESYSAVAGKFSKTMEVHGTTEIEGSRSLDKVVNVSPRQEKYENNTGENGVTSVGSTILIDQVHIESFPFHDQDVHTRYSDTLSKKYVFSALKSFSQINAASNASKNMRLITGSGHNECSDVGCSTWCLYSSDKLKSLLKEEGGCASTCIGNFNNKMLEKFGKYLALRRFQLNCAMQEALLHSSKADAGSKTLAKVQAKGLELPVKNERKTCPHTLTKGRKPAERASEQAVPDNSTPHSIMKALQDLKLEDIHDSVLMTDDKAWEKGLAHSYYFKEFFNEIWNADVKSSLNNLQDNSTEARAMPETSSGEALSKLCDSISIQAGYKSRLDGPSRDLSPLRVIFEDRNKELLHDLLLSLTEEEQLIKEAWAYNMKQMLNSSQDSKGNTQSEPFNELGNLGDSPTMLTHKDKFDTLHRKFIEGKTRALERTDHTKTQSQQFPKDIDFNECSKDNANSVEALGVDTKKFGISKFQSRSCQQKPLLLSDSKKNNEDSTKDLENRGKVVGLMDSSNNPGSFVPKQVKRKVMTSTGKASMRGHDSLSSNNKQLKQKAQLFIASSNNRERMPLKITHVLPNFSYVEDKNGLGNEESEQCPLASLKQTVAAIPIVTVSEDTTFKINNIRNYTRPVDRGSEQSQQSQINIGEVQAKSLCLWLSEVSKQPNYSSHQQTHAKYEAEAQQKFSNDAELCVPDHAIITPEFSHSESDFVSLQTVTDNESKDRAVARLIPSKIEHTNGTCSLLALHVLRDTDFDKEHKLLHVARASPDSRHSLKKPDTAFDANPSELSPDEKIFLERFYAKDYLY